MRYKIVKAVCVLLRHPDKETWYANGRAELRCPCGYINLIYRDFPISSWTSNQELDNDKSG